MDSIFSKVSFERSILWLVLIVYLVVTGFAISHHEMWGDEIHSWNIAKGSATYSDLIHNIRFEGHPPVWYTILWPISKFSHNLAFVQFAHWLIAGITIFLLLFYSPIPLPAKTLIPFGYYFLFEYSVLSRNYAIGILLASCICILIRKEFRFKLLLYYLLLLLMSNTHLLALVLAGCLHLYFLILTFERNSDRRKITLHVLLCVLVCIPSLYFIFPPSDSQLNVHYWIDRWKPEQVKALGQAPLRSFVPIPAWWNYHFWNTQFLLDSSNKSKLLNLTVALISLGMAVGILFKNKKSLTVFLANLFLSFIIALAVFPLTSGRYAGFLFIGFIVAYWLYCYEISTTRTNKILVNLLLFVQALSGIFMVYKDLRLPFSNAGRVNELLSIPPANSRIVTDYWAMNTISAFADKPIYCIDIQREISFVLWGPELGEMLKRTYRYYDGVNNLFQTEKINQVYMISTGSPQVLDRADPKLFKAYSVLLLDKREGAIEKGGNLYLYKINTR